MNGTILPSLETNEKQSPTVAEVAETEMIELGEIEILKPKGSICTP